MVVWLNFSYIYNVTMWDHNPLTTCLVNEFSYIEFIQYILPLYSNHWSIMVLFIRNNRVENTSAVFF